MEEIKFYFDEHMDYAVSEGLRRRGIDVLTVQAALRRGLPDDDQIDYALQEGRVLVTMDSDYIALAAQGIPHAGIAFIQPGTSIRQMIDALLLLHGALTPDDMKDHVGHLPRTIRVSRLCSPTGAGSLARANFWNYPPPTRVNPASLAVRAGRALPCFIRLSV